LYRPGVAGHRLFPVVSDHHHLLQQADVPQAPCSGGDCELLPASWADGNDSNVSYQCCCDPLSLLADRLSESAEHVCNRK
jgi:hypothetical protein